MSEVQEKNRLRIRKLGGKLPFLRYLVPFCVEYRDSDMEAAVRALCESGDFRLLSRADMVPSHEEDLYDFLYSDLVPGRGTEEKGGTNLGCQLKAQNFEYRQMYYHYVSRGERLTKPFFITQKGLVLFKNGISFYWYDVKIDFEDPDELVLFQNRFKELNVIRFTKSGDNQFHFSETLAEDGRLFTMGSTIAAELGRYFPQVSYFPARFNEALRQEKLRELKNKRQERLAEWKQQAEPYEQSEAYQAENRRYAAEKEHWLGLSLDEALRDPGSLALPDGESRPVTVPDRAILYSYIVFDAEREAGTEEDKQALISEMCRYAYYFARGYKESYRVTKDAKNERQHMFFRHENDLWEASIEGCGCFVLISDHLFDKKGKRRSNTFYDSIRVNEMQGDYFIMLLHLLYQYFSVTLYSEQIARILPQETQAYLEYGEGTEALYRRILGCKVQMDVFFSSCMYRSVSHTTDMGRIYAYLEDTMQIRKNTDSIKQGISNLESLERSMMDRIQSDKKEKLNNVVSFTGFFLGLISLILGYEDIISFAGTLRDLLGLGTVGFYVIAVLLFGAMLGLEAVVFVNLIRYIRKSKT